MEYKEGYVENNQLKVKNIKVVDQSTMTSDCWLIQFNGLSACENCDIKHTDECSGGLTLNKLIVDKHYVLFDNGGETSDRYTAINKEDLSVFAFNDAPFHPQGFGQYSGEFQNKTIKEIEEFGHLGQKIFANVLNEDCITFLLDRNE